MLRRLFQLDRYKTTVTREVLGGATTFVAMAYIIVVNPAILGSPDLPPGQAIPPGPSTVATILVAVFGCLLMGLYANRPIAVAPYMGENVFLAFGLVSLGITWQQRLGSVFLAGLAFLVLTVLRLRTWLAEAISPSLKHAFAVGIGLFLVLLGLYQTGLVTSSVAGLPPAPWLRPDGTLRPPEVPLKIGNVRDPQVLLAVGGFLLMVILMARRVPGAILLGIIVTAVAGGLLGYGQAPTAAFALPFIGPYDLSPIALQFDLRGVLQLSFLPVLVTLFLMSFLDTLGSLVGLGAAADLLDEHGNFPQVERPMLVDALSCVFAASVGTSTSGAYIESAAGIREGARTGLAACVTGLFFAVALFFIPLFEPLQSLRFAYGPALIAVGLLMAPAVTRIDFHDLTEAVPALATVAMMVFTYNIANGLTVGLILHPFLKLAAGRGREVRLASLLLALLCLLYFLFGRPH